MKDYNTVAASIGERWKDTDIEKKFDADSRIGKDHKYRDRKRTIVRNVSIINTYLDELYLGGNSVLDISCGSGVLLEILKVYGNKVCGTDIPKVSYSIITDSQKIPVQYFDCRKLPYPVSDKSYDYITCIGAMSAYGGDLWISIMSEFFRIAKKVVFVGFNVGDLYDAYKQSIIDLVLPEGWSRVIYKGSYFKYEYTGVKEKVTPVPKSNPSGGMSRETVVVQPKNATTFSSLQKFEKLHTGHCFIIGGGESIKEWKNKGVDFDKLFSNEITIGMNKSYKLGKSKYHIVFDLPYFEKEKDILTKLDTQLFVTSNITNKFPEISNCAIKPYRGRPKLMSDAFSEGLYYGKSSGYLSLNVAQLMGFNPIYLLGIDLVGGHFHEGYGEKAQKRLQRDHQVIEGELRKGIQYLKNKGINVISLSPVSKLNDIITYDSSILEKYIK